MAEAVTLAHVVRPLVLARAAASAGHEVVFACDQRAHWLLPDFPGPVEHISTIASNVFLRALDKGKPVFSSEVLRSNVRTDLALIERVRPDLVVGDFRLSLGVSARLAGVRYAAIGNAHWHPRIGEQIPLLAPVLARIVGNAVAERVFRAMLPFALARQARPFNRVRRQYDLPTVADVRHVYTLADDLLLDEVPEYFSATPVPPEVHFLGPILWEPQNETPSWWGTWPSDKPVVYVTLGSSGSRTSFPDVVAAIADLPVTVIAASAGPAPAVANRSNVFVAPYLPGRRACAAATLVVGNGGSGVMHQALSEGRPSLALTTNLDQRLNAQKVVREGAAVLMQDTPAAPQRVRTEVERILADDAIRESARRVQQWYQRHDAPSAFIRYLAESKAT